MRGLTLLFLFACITLPSAAQQNSIQGVKLDKPPTLDGIISPEEWDKVPSVRTGFDEQTGAAVPKEWESTYWLAYDDTFIYFAARNLDPETSQIRATEYRTNASVRGDDFILLGVDPFSTLSDTSQFEVNPRGATYPRIAGGRAAKREWLGEMEAKGRITAEGWEVEGRIPWAIMRLPSAGTRDLRFIFGRVIARTGRAYLSDNIAGGKVNNIGIWKAVDVPRPPLRRTLKLLPYAYGGVDEDKGTIANSGLDFKAPITSDLDLVGSINPDFRNIENQVLSIDFSYFERLAGESRPFFLEGESYFQTSRDAPLFASQRITDFDIGLKTYGKVGEKTTLGILNTTDFSNQNSLVGDFRYNFGTRTSAQVAVANLERPDVSNMGTFAAFYHGMGAFDLFAQHMTTNDTHLGEGHRYNTGFSFNQAGLNSALEYVEISPEFLPRLGFAPERDFKGYTTFLQYTKPMNLGRINEMAFGFDGRDLKRFDGSMYRRKVGFNGSLTLRDGTDFDIAASFEEFQGFKDRYFFISMEKPRGDPYRHWQFNYVTGNIADHSYRSIAPSINYRPLKTLQLNLMYQRVDHFTRQEQTILSANYELNQTDAVSGRAIRRDDDTNFYLAWRRTGNRGAEYYVILGDPNASTFRTSIVIKAVFPFELRF